MGEQNLFRNYFQIFTALDYCIEKKLIIPALVLLYSSIDSISWIASNDENQLVSERFQTWVNTWMLKKYPLPCTAIELYAARCGILHTLTPNASLNEKKDVRFISYAWGTSQQKDLEKVIELINFPGLVAVHVNDIIYSFKNGLADFFEALEADLVNKELFSLKAKKHFSNVENSVISEFLVSYKKKET